MAAIAQDVTGFWRHAGPRRWFKAERAFDDAIRLKFEPVHHRAARGEYDAWASGAEGALALMILLDQFPRNLYRNSAHAFATDPKARTIARRAVESGLDAQIEPELRGFFYLPFEHSEDAADQEFSLALFVALGDDEMLRYAKLHHEIIARFGRFPHRNPALGRVMTAEEQAYLDDGGFAG
ncbi:MAG: DUF924 family protein [Phenylobacterium sp.]|nr:DUF924 family protein [Phenylobacterium sp.]MDP3175744.1 DUF924 family protein [Phenylobacterium sp.]